MMEAHIPCPCGGRAVFCGRRTLALDGAPHLGELTARPVPLELYLCPACGRVQPMLPQGERPDLDALTRLLAPLEKAELEAIAAQPLSTVQTQAAARHILRERGLTP